MRCGSYPHREEKYLAQGVATAHEKFDASGALVDEVTRKRLERTLDHFATWIRTLASPGAG